MWLCCFRYRYSEVLSRKRPDTKCSEINMGFEVLFQIIWFVCIMNLRLRLAIVLVGVCVCVCACVRVCVWEREGRREGKGWLQVHTYIHYQSRFIELYSSMIYRIAKNCAYLQQKFLYPGSTWPLNKEALTSPGPAQRWHQRHAPGLAKHPVGKRGQLWAWRGRQMWLERHSRLFLLLCSAPGSPPLPSVHLSLPVCLLFLAFIHIHHLLPHSFHPSLRPPPRLPSHP